MPANLTMVSRDLTCDETMPPLDEGDNMIGMRIVRASSNANHLQNTITHQDNANSSHGDSSRSIIRGNEIASEDSHITVREVVNRQIRNSKLRNESNLGFSKFGLLTTTLPQFDASSAEAPSNYQILFNNPTNNHNRHKNMNGRLTAGGRKNAHVQNNDDFSTQSSIITKTNYLLPNHQMTTLNSSSINHPLVSNCSQHIIGSHLEQISKNWAQQPPDPQQQYQSPKKAVQIRNMLLPNQSVTTTIAIGPASSKQFVHQTQNCSYQAVMPPDGMGSTVNEPNNHQNTTTTHSSPRPSILRGNNSLRRLADRPASASGVCDVFGNGTIRGINQNGEESNGGEETPRKRARKQHFGDTTAQPDKLMMEVYADSRFEQSASAGPSLDHQQSSSVIDSTSLLPSTGIGRDNVRKKRGRPKINNNQPIAPHIPISFQTTTNHNQQFNLKHPLEENISTNSTLNLGLSTIVNANGHAASTSRVMVELDPILQDSITKKRRYKKKVPDNNLQTGEILKRMRKKGSGRKSKREMELAAQQQRESAILAGVGMVGFPTTTTNQHHLIVAGPSITASSTSSFNDQQQNYTFNISNSQQQIFIYSQQHPQSSTQQIDANEQDVIHALCRFRRDSEQQRAEIATKDASITTQKISNTTAVNHLPKESISYIPTREKLTKTSFPLLSNLGEFSNELRPLIRRCEKGLNISDNRHLIESYKELFNLLAANSAAIKTTVGKMKTLQSEATSSEYEPIPQIFERISNRISCPIFDSYEKYKSSMHGLRLMPQACAYLDASQRLLHSIRTNLIGHSLYKLLRNRDKAKSQNVDRKINAEDETKLVSFSTLKLHGGEEKKKEETKNLFRLFLNESNNFEKNKADVFPSDNNLLNEQILLQLDVAQTLNLLLDRVSRDQLCCFVDKSIDYTAEQLSSKSKLNALSSASILEHPMPVYNDITKRIPKPFLEMINSKRKKLRKMEIWSDDEEEKIEEFEAQKMLDCPATSQSQVIEAESEWRRHWKSMLDRVYAVCAKTKQDFDHLAKTGKQLNSLLETLEDRQNNQMNNSATGTSLRSTLLPKLDVQRKRNPHKSNQFLFRPPSQLIEELLKDIAHHQEASTIETIPSTSEHIEKEREEVSMKIRQTLNNEEKEEQTKLVMEDVDELLTSSEHISIKSLAELQLRYNRNNERRDTKSCLANAKALLSNNQQSIMHKNERAGFEQFKPALYHLFLSDFTPEQHRTFLKSRIRETKEIQETTIGLVENRETLVKECVKSIQEIFEGDQTICKANEHLDEVNSEEQQKNMKNRAMSPDSPPIPTKRAAHWRALSNMQSTSRAESMSRGSVEMDTG